MVQEVTSTSWGKRILNALWGILLGIVLIFAAIYLVFWNEGHSLQTAQSLQEVQKIMVSVPSSPIDSKHESHVVYVSGMATTNDRLQDKLFNITEQAIQLNRHVDMYQWQEQVDTKTEKQMGGSEQEVKTYSYKQVWSDQLINSSEFKEQANHANPTVMPLKSKVQYANKVTLGDFSLSNELITQISGDTNVDLAKADIAMLEKKFKHKVQVDGDGLYFGEDSATPKVGDLRVMMTMVAPGVVSIIAQQANNNLQAYAAAAGQTVLLIEMGQVSPQAMIQHALTENQVMTWVLRLVSLVLMIIGFALIMQPIVVLADVIPFFGNLVGFGTGLIAFICGLGVWAIAVAIVWFAVRPLVAIGLLVIVAIACYLLFKRKQNRAKF
jgi:hypothetical protein